MQEIRAVFYADEWYIILLDPSDELIVRHTQEFTITVFVPVSSAIIAQVDVVGKAGRMVCARRVVHASFWSQFELG
jgi:hypothetical protein